MFTHVSVWGIILAALSAMVIGMIWYSPMVFGKPWMKAIGLTEKQMNAKMSSAVPVLILVSLLTAYALSLLTVYIRGYANSGNLATGVYASLFAWAGFGLTSVVAHGVFEPRDREVMFINAGNRLVTLLSMGLIIGDFLSH